MLRQRLVSRHSSAIQCLPPPTHTAVVNQQLVIYRSDTASNYYSRVSPSSRLCEESVIWPGPFHMGVKMRSRTGQIRTSQHVLAHRTVHRPPVRLCIEGSDGAKLRNLGYWKSPLWVICHSALAHGTSPLSQWFPQGSVHQISVWGYPITGRVRQTGRNKVYMERDKLRH